MRFLIGLPALMMGLTGANGQEPMPTCTNAGNVYEVGELACIAACHGQRRLAKCEVVANAPTWTPVSNACPSAMMMLLPQWANLSEKPAVVAMSPMPLDINSSPTALVLAPTDRL